MVRKRLLQIIRSLISHIHQQCRGLTIDKSKDAVVHVLHLTRYWPVETLLERVQCPKTCIVALGGDDRIGTKDGGYLTSEFVCPSHVTGKHSDDMLTEAVHTHHRWIFVLVLHKGAMVLTQMPMAPMKMKASK